ncbi:MAG TPA: glycogen-binding domain-containing protein [Gemmatimonadales bacterium]|nr:glycogen-binding domain-containing protein [Gemmatimonadales bacterium]
MTRGIAALLVAVGTGAAPLTAQADASLALGVGTVRYPGGTSFSSATLSPAIRYASSTFAADGSGALASLPDGVWSTQARADFWGTTRPLAPAWRLGLEALFVGTTLGGTSSSGAAHGVAEVLWSARDWGLGVGAGPSTGGSSGELPVVALHTRARAWWRPRSAADAPELHLSLEPTSFPDGWFTDATVSGSLERGRAVGSLWIAARLSSAFGSKLTGGGLVQVAAGPRVTLELSGGSYLADPYQGLPRAAFLTFGVRLRGAPRRARAAAPPLVPGRRGDTLIVRIHMAQAHSVAMAGDWNAWQPTELRPLGEDVWESTLLLAPGLYHFNLLVDGTEWVVPNGVATVPDGLGGMVAVLVVP